MKIFLIALLVTAVCGVPLTSNRKNGPRSPKIVGGEAAYEGEFAYQVSFRRERVDDTDWHFCGGSILDTMTIIDAAHCVASEDLESPLNLLIMAGERTAHPLAISTTAQKIAVSHITIHQNYIASNTTNDISLLHLVSPLVFNDYVQPITLPDQDEEPAVGTYFNVTGWGTLASGGDTPINLQWVSVPYVTDLECRDDYGASQIADSMICAGALGIDSCQGDSGGPMNDGNKQVGIVSWGRGCALEGYPGVYTQLSYFVDWVIKNQGNLAGGQGN